MDAAGRESKRGRSSFDSVCPENYDGESDIDSHGDEEAVLLAAAAWSEKQTGSARVAPSELRDSRSLLVQGNNMEEEYVAKLIGSSEVLGKLKAVLEESLVESTMEAGEGDSSSVLVCKFPSMAEYETILGSHLGDFDGIQLLEPLKGIKKRKRVEYTKETKRVSSRRAAIMMKPRIAK